MALYFDCDAPFWQPDAAWRDMSPVEWDDWFQPGISAARQERGGTARRREYVLSPVDGQALYTRRGRGVRREEGQAILELDFSLDVIQLQLTRALPSCLLLFERWCLLSVLERMEVGVKGWEPGPGLWLCAVAAAPDSRACPWWHCSLLPRCARCRAPVPELPAAAGGGVALHGAHRAQRLPPAHAPRGWKKRPDLVALRRAGGAAAAPRALPHLAAGRAGACCVLFFEPCSHALGCPARVFTYKSLVN